MFEAEDQNLDVEIIHNKTMRRDLDENLQSLKGLTKSRERSLAITKLQEAIMWIGMDLKRLSEQGVKGVENPYPESYNPDNTTVHKTADNLKL